MAFNIKGLPILWNLITERCDGVRYQGPTNLKRVNNNVAHSSRRDRETPLIEATRDLEQSNSV